MLFFTNFCLFVRCVSVLFTNQHSHTAQSFTSNLFAPNDWAAAVCNLHYILDLLLSVIHIPTKTVALVGRFAASGGGVLTATHTCMEQRIPTT